VERSFIFVPLHHYQKTISKSLDSLCYALQFGGIIHIDLASDPEVGLSE
jgi:hypothetical protein